MDYKRIYDDLMAKAVQRQLALPITVAYERHHILPKSMGGKDEANNLVHLTIKEHRLAHLLLFKAGNLNQIYSVAAIQQDYLNKYRPLRYRNPALHPTHFIRRVIAKGQSLARRQSNKEQLKMTHKIQKKTK